MRRALGKFQLPLSLLALAILATATDAWATTYYVKTTGNDSNSGTSSSAAFKTITKAAQVAAAGDTVYVGGGTYANAVAVTNDGTSGSPIKFIADTAGTYTGVSGTVTLSPNNAWVVQNDNYIQIIGFTFTGDNAVLWETSVGGLLQDCEITTSQEAIKVNGATLTVQSCNIHDNAQEGIYVLGASNLTVLNTTIANSALQGININAATTITLEDCSIYSCGRQGVYVDQNNTTDTLTMRRCVIWYNSYEGVGAEGVGQVTLENCFVAVNGEEGIYASANTPVVRVYHCDVVYNGKDGVRRDNGTTTITNSILAWNGFYGLRGTSTHTYNLFYGNSSGHVSGTTVQASEKTVDPLFVSSSDLHLQGSSPCVDAGTNVGLTTDYEGSSRPQGSGYDIGCYESEASGNGSGPYNYFVRATGNDANHGRSASAAFRTITKAATVAAAGDKVYVGAGTFSGDVDITNDGTSTSPIQFLADSSGAKTGDAGNVILSGRFRASSDNYIQISGFKITNATASAIGVTWSNSVGGVIENCEIYGCTSEGIFVDVGSNVTISRSTIRNNGGEGIDVNSTATIVNCLLINNTRSGIEANTSASVTVQHCTAAYNSIDGFERNSGTMSVVNSISAFNTGSGFMGTITHTYSCAYGNGTNYTGSSAGTGDIQANPKFQASGNYHLQSVSPAADRATTLGSVLVDLENSGRPQGTAPDMGCYETAGTAGTYYVRTTGNDTNDGLAANRAFRTINRAAGYVRDGSIVYVGAGTYAESITLIQSGTSSNPVRFVADTTGANTGDAGTVTISATANGGTILTATSIDYNTFEGFRIGTSTYTSVTGVQASNCISLWFKNCTVRDNNQGIAANSCGLIAEDCTFTSNTSPFTSTTGATYFEDTNFLTNTSGPHSNADTFFCAKNCRFEGSSNAGVTSTRPTASPYYTSSDVTRYAPVTTAAGYSMGSAHARFVGCTITSNVRGLSLANYSTLSDVVFSTTTNQNNTSYGWELTSCQLSFTTSNWSSWPLGTNGAGITGSSSNLTFNGQTLSNFASGYAVLCTGGTLSLTNCTIQSNYGGVSTSATTSLTANTCTIRQNSTRGVSAAGIVQLTGCTLSQNDVGLYLNGTTTANVTLSTTTISNNTTDGVSLYNGTLALTASNQNNWILTGNGVGLHADTSTLTVTSFEVSGNTVGISSSNGSLTLSSATLRNNSTGLVASNNTSLQVNNSTITNNTSWGVTLTGRGQFTGSTISSNQSGILLQSGTDALVTFSNMTLQNNTDAAVYFSSCTMTLSPAKFGTTTISGSKSAYIANTSTLTVQGHTVSGGTEVGLASYNGTLTSSNSTYSGNGTGLYLEGNSAVTCTNDQFRNNTLHGARVKGIATFAQCTFQNNPNGLTLRQCTPGQVTLTSSQILNNTNYGVFADNSNLAFTSSMQSNWVTTGNGASFGGDASTLSFTSFQISGGTTYGLVCLNGSAATLTNATVSGNGTGVYTDANSTLTASGTTFRNNTEAGATVFGQTALTSCSFESNKHGLRLESLTNSKLSGSGNTITSNTQYGLYLNACTMTVNSALASLFSITNNTYGIYAAASTVAFDGYTSNSNTYGALLTGSAVTVSNSTFQGSSTGFTSLTNTSFTATNSNFRNNTAWGVVVYGNGSFNTCNITNNVDGVYFSGTAVTDSRLTSTTIADNSGTGLTVSGGSLNLSSQTANQWTITHNGTNIFGNGCDVDLTGVTLSNAATYGVQAWYGSLDIIGSTISSNSYGILTMYNSAVSAKRSSISGSATSGWAWAHYNGNLDIQNTIMPNSMYGVYVYAPAATANIYNVTLANAGYYGIYVQDGTANIKNTIVAGKGSGYGISRAGGTVTHSYNLISGFANAFSNTTAASTEVLKDPHFQDSTAGDFRLAKGSPAINAGTDLAALFTTDLSGNARPSHEVFEIGAYEFMDAAGSFRVIDWQETR